MLNLKDLRARCQERDIPIISSATEQFLQKKLTEIKPKVCLEIGGAVGYSGIFMAGLLNKRGGKLYSFELSYPGYREGHYNSVASQSYNLISYPYNFLQAPILKLLTENKVDLVFIDGRKSEYGSYLEKLESLCEDKTVIIIDDVIKYHHKLISLYGYLEKKQIKYNVLQLDPDDGIMIIN